MNINNSRNKKRITYIILFIIIALQLVRIVYSFVYLKEDYHQDEQWSFGLANSYYNPFIYADDDCIKIENYSEWLSSDVFKDYMTVDKDHRFSYRSVIYNQTKDVHPPLYYWVLNTIFSFFPGKFSYWYGFIVNIAAFTVIQIYLFRTVEYISKSSEAALICCIFYGLSTGCLDTVIFLRMYAMMTMFSVMSAFYHVRLYYEKNLRRELPFLFIITLSGALTNHFFPVYAGIMSACFCVWYLAKKDMKNLFVYAFTMLASIAVSILIFPATIAHFTSPRIAGAKYTFLWQFGICVNFILFELFGFKISVFKTPFWSILAGIIVCILILSLPVAYLFRNKFNAGKIKECFGKIFSEISGFLKSVEAPVLFMFLAALSAVVVTALKVSIVRIHVNTDRYIFYIYPEVCAVFVIFVYRLFHRYIKSYKACMIILSAVIMVFTFNSNINNKDNIYFFSKDEGHTDMTEYIEGSNCIYINDEVWILTCFADKFMNANKILAVRSENSLSFDYTLPDDDHSAYLIIHAKIFDDPENSELDQMEAFTGGAVVQNGSDFSGKFSDSYITEEKLISRIENGTGKKAEYIGFDNSFTRKYYIYKLS